MNRNGTNHHRRHRANLDARSNSDLAAFVAPFLGSLLLIVMVVLPTGCAKDETPEATPAGLDSVAPKPAVVSPGGYDDETTVLPAGAAPTGSREPAHKTTSTTGPRGVESVSTVFDWDAAKQRALEATCEAAELPKPPDLAQLPPDFARLLQRAINEAAQHRSTETIGRLARIYHATATTREQTDRPIACYELAKSLDPGSYQWPVYLGRLFLSRQSFPRARIELEQAVKLNPDYAATHANLGELDLQQGATGEAKGRFGRFLELRPDDPYGLTAMAAAELKTGNNDSAFEFLQRSLELQPRRFRTHRLLAEYYAKTGDRKRAGEIRAGSQGLPRNIGLLARDPLELELWAALDDTGVARQRTVMFASAGDQDSAILLSETLVHDHPKSTLLLINLGQQYLYAGRDDEAAAAADRALNLDPGQVHALVLLADCRFQQARFADGLDAADRAVRADDRFAAGHVARGMALAAMGRDAEAETAYRQAIVYAPGNRTSISSLAETLVAQWKFAEAKELYLRLLSADQQKISAIAAPQRVQIYMVLAGVCMSEQAFDEAIKYLDQALQLSPGNPAALQRRTDALVAAGRSDQVVSEWRNSVRDSPENPFYLFMLGVVLGRTGNAGEAIDYLRKSAELSSDKVGVHFELARALRDQRRNPEAVEALLDAIRVQPRFVDAYLLLVAIVLETGDYERAERTLRTGIEQVPEAPPLLNSLAWMLATSPDVAHRNPTEAVALAEKACRLSNNEVASFLDTLAAAQASAGRYEDAAQNMRKAISMGAKSGDTTGLDEFRARLALYEQRKPFYEEE